MSRFTLATVLKEIKDEFKKRDAIADMRFEFIKEQVQSTRAELKEFKAEMTDFKTEVKAGFVLGRSSYLEFNIPSNSR